MSSNIYYVYQYYDPIRKEPIYIGKGSDNRIYRHLSRKDKHPFINRINWIRKQGQEPIITILQKDLTDKQALKLEGQIERKIGRKNIGKGPLLNLKPCGLDGGSGPHSMETKIKIKQNHADVSGKNNPMYGKHNLHTEETKSKISKSNLGKHKYWLGKHHSEETKSKMRKSHIKFMEL